MIDLIYDNGFKERFALLIKYFGTAANAAKLVGIAPDQIGRWRDGTARPANHTFIHRINFSCVHNRLIQSSPVLINTPIKFIRRTNITFRKRKRL